MPCCFERDVQRLNEPCHYHGRWLHLSAQDLSESLSVDFCCGGQVFNLLESGIKHIFFQRNHICNKLGFQIITSRAPYLLRKFMIIPRCAYVNTHRVSF